MKREWERSQRCYVFSTYHNLIMDLPFLFLAFLHFLILLLYLQDIMPLLLLFHLSFLCIPKEHNSPML